jgi:hypothetical protein
MQMSLKDLLLQLQLRAARIRCQMRRLRNWLSRSHPSAHRPSSAAAQTPNAKCLSQSALICSSRAHAQSPFEGLKCAVALIATA